MREWTSRCVRSLCLLTDGFSHLDGIGFIVVLRMEAIFIIISQVWVFHTHSIYQLENFCFNLNFCLGDGISISLSSILQHLSSTYNSWQFKESKIGLSGPLFSKKSLLCFYGTLSHNYYFNLFFHIFYYLTYVILCSKDEFFSFVFTKNIGFFLDV